MYNGDIERLMSVSSTTSFETQTEMRDMSDKKQRAEAISATAFVEAYVKVHQNGGTIAASFF